MEKSKYLHCGEIINTHGVRGALKVRADCDSPEILASLPRIFIKKGESCEARDIVSASIQKSFVLLTLSGVDDIDAAISLKGTEIFAEREELSKYLAEGDRFIADLLGLPVLHAETNEKLGVLINIFNAGASDIYVIDTSCANGNADKSADKGACERMMPAVAEFVDRITDDAVYVKPIPGMLD